MNWVILTKTERERAMGPHILMIPPQARIASSVPLRTAKRIEKKDESKWEIEKGEVGGMEELR